MVELVGSIIVAIITGVCTVTVSVIGNKKTQTLLNYRMDQVEKAVNVHSGFEGRIIRLESEVNEMKNNIDDLKKEMKGMVRK